MYGYRYAYGAALMTSAFFALGFFVPYVGEPLALVGFIPLFWQLSKERWSYKESFLFFFLGGVFFFGATLAWMFALLPLEWAGVESAWKAYAVFLPGWFAILCLFAFWWGVFGLCARYVLMQTSACHSAVATVSLGIFWVITEYARSFMVGFLGFSPAHSTFFSQWTFGSLVYGMTDGWMIVLASVGGIYLINFVIMVCNGWIFLQLTKSNTPRKAFLGTAVIFLGTVFLSTCFGVLVSTWYERAYRSAPSQEIAAMRTDIPRAFLYSKDARVAPLGEAVSAAVSLTKKIDVLVAPEGADMLSFDASNGMRLVSRLKKDGAVLADHVYLQQQSGKLESRTLYWRPEDGIMGFQGKRILMPVGEYIPSLAKAVLLFFGYEQRVHSYEAAYALASSEKGFPVTDMNTRAVYASAVCSEASNPDVIRSLAKTGAEVIFLQASDTLFRGNYFYARYMIAMARVRAVESGRFVVRASNAGPAVIIDSLGRVRVEKNKGNGIIHYKVPLVSIYTPYVRWSN